MPVPVVPPVPEVPPVATAPVVTALVVDELLDVSEDDEPTLLLLVVLELDCPVPLVPLPTGPVVPVEVAAAVVEGSMGIAVSCGIMPVAPTPSVTPSACGSLLQPKSSRASNAVRSHAIQRV